MRDLARDTKTLMLLHLFTNLKCKAKCLRRYRKGITQRLVILWGNGSRYFFFYFERKVYSRKCVLPKEGSGLCPWLLGGHL